MFIKRSILEEGNVPVEEAWLDTGAATVETCDSSDAIAVRARFGFVDWVFSSAVANCTCDDFGTFAFYAQLSVDALLGAFTLALSPGDEGDAAANAGSAREQGQDRVLFNHARRGASGRAAALGHIDGWLGPEGCPA